MILSTTHTIEGKTIGDYRGIVTGEAIIGANIFRDFFAGIRDIVGGRSGAYEKELQKAREIAFEELTPDSNSTRRCRRRLVVAVLQPRVIANARICSHLPEAACAPPARPRVGRIRVCPGLHMGPAPCRTDSRVSRTPHGRINGIAYYVVAGTVIGRNAVGLDWLPDEAVYWAALAVLVSTLISMFDCLRALTKLRTD